MTRPNLPARAEDAARGIARLEAVERRFSLQGTQATLPGVTTPPSAGSFPIEGDDGTYTQRIAVATHDIQISVTEDAGTHLTERLGIGPGGFYVDDYDGNGTFFNDHAGGGTFFNLGAGGGFFVNDGTHSGFTGAGGIFLKTTSTDGGVFLDALSGAGVFITGDGGVFIAPSSLPTSDPGVSGQLWNAGGTLKVSP